MRSGIATGDGGAPPGSALTGPLTTLPKFGAGGRAPPGNAGTGGVELGAYGKPDGAAPNPGCGGKPIGAAGDGTDGAERADEDGSAPAGIAGEASAGNEPGSGAEDGAKGNDVDGTCATCGAAALGVNGAALGAFGSPACSKKYGVELGVRESALSINSSGVGPPNNSAKSVGAGRTSASFGNGLAAKGGVWNTPGVGGCVAAPESPPPPTLAALGPTRGGGKGPSTGVGPDTGGAITPALCAPTPGVASDAGGTSPDGDPSGETDKPAKNSLAMRDTSPTIAAKSKAEVPVGFDSTEGAPPRKSLVLIVITGIDVVRLGRAESLVLVVVTDIDVLQHRDGVVREHRSRAIQRNQVRRGAAIVDAHPAHGQAWAHLPRNTRLK